MTTKYSLVSFSIIIGLTLFIALSSVTGVRAAGPVISVVYTHGSYETAGVIITLAQSDGNETATIEYKKETDSTYQGGHPFTKYDGNNMATSLFDLTPDTVYDLRITLNDSDNIPSSTVTTSQVKTKPDFSIPLPIRITKVSQGENLQSVIDKASAGDEIIVGPGVYEPIKIEFRRQADERSPIWIRAEQANNMPIIEAGNLDYGILINDSSHWYIDGFEVRNADKQGVYIRASRGIVLQNSNIHDSKEYNVLISKSNLYTPGATLGGYHLIQNNTITDGRHGIQLDNNAGAGTVVRNNVVTGGRDNIKVCGSETAGRDLVEDTAHVLAITGGTWTNHDTEVYDNTFSTATDDNIEIDGICVNARVYRNSLKDALNPFSIAPMMPGPLFVLRNDIRGHWTEAGLKMNTNGNSAVPSRNAYIYHNTFARDTSGPLINAWYANEGQHNVPIKNYVFKNNIFSSPMGGRAIDVSVSVPNAQNPVFNNNLWWTTTSQSVFEWWTDKKNQYETFGTFQLATGQEAKGLFADPILDSSARLTNSSPAVDRGEIIPGINNNFSGNGPDLGAFESSFSATVPTITPLPSSIPSATPSQAPGTRPKPSDYGLVEGDVISSFDTDGDLDIYIVNTSGFKRLFVSPAIFGIYGHIGYGSVRSIVASTRDVFATSGLFKNCESGSDKVWALEVIDEDNAVLHHVNMTGSLAVAEDPEFFAKVFCINNAEEALYPKSQEEYTSLSQVPDYSR